MPLKKFVPRRKASLYYIDQTGARRALAMARKRTKDKRDLDSVVRSHKAANPYQITPSAGRTVSFWRQATYSVPLNESIGFTVGGISSFNLNFGFALGNVFGILGGTFAFLATVPSASELQALFDYYCINAVKIKIFFTNNYSNVNSPSTALPIIHMCNDFDDINEVMSLPAMLQRVGCRTVQFDGNNVNGINHYIKPKPAGVVVQTDTATGVQSSANAGIPFYTTWLDIAQSNIVHNGLKLFYNSRGRTSNTEQVS